MVRVKKRYILAEIKPEKQVNFPTQDAFTSEFKKKFYELYGDFGIACLNRNYVVKRFNPKDHSIILVVRKGVHEMALSTLPFITTIDGKACCVRIVHLSGTIRKCFEVVKRQNIMSLRAVIGKQIQKETTLIK